MALVKCPECGENISMSASVCPHCGFPVKKAKTSVKPLIIVIVSVVVVAAICVCLWAAFLRNPKKIQFLQQDGTILIPSDASVAIKDLNESEAADIDRIMRAAVKAYNGTDVDEDVRYNDFFASFNDQFGEILDKWDSQKYLNPIAQIALLQTDIRVHGGMRGSGSTPVMSISRSDWNNMRDLIIAAAEYYYNGGEYVLPSALEK